MRDTVVVFFGLIIAVNLGLWWHTVLTRPTTALAVTYDWARWLFVGCTAICGIFAVTTLLTGWWLGGAVYAFGSVYWALMAEHGFWLSKQLQEVGSDPP